MTTLATMVSRLQADVPADGGVPTSGQYEQAVRDAVADFSRRCGLVKIGTLSVEAGTATYALATDFLKMIELLTIHYAGTLVTDVLIPVNPSFTKEQFTIANRQITLFPTPAYTMDRDYRYKAAWVETAGDFTTLGDAETDIVLLAAKASALQMQANALSGKVLKYSLGAVSVDKGSAVEKRESRSASYLAQYEAAVAKYNGSYMAFGEV